MSLQSPNRSLKGAVNLPASKSESNRAVMIAAYGGFEACAENLSDANDTQVLQRLLKQVEVGENHRIDCEDAGTACRFLLTYLSGKRGQWLLTGTERLKQRPIDGLVRALRHLGASIAYVENGQGLPLLIQGTRLQGGEATVGMEQSSQFASSLLLAAPHWKHGLTLRLDGDMTSTPYLDLTIAMMRRSGAQVLRDNREIRVEPGAYHQAIVPVSPDWSAASYWFEAAALSAECDLLLRRLAFDSLQGDKAIADMMKPFGVEATQHPDGIRLRKTEKVSQNRIFDFSQTPDLFPAVAATCAGLKQKARFVGVKNLALKESNRLDAMAEELLKIGVRIERESEDVVMLNPTDSNADDNDKTIFFDSHNDHRIAMSLAFMSLIHSDVRIQDPNVVKKSYQHFWKEFEKIVG